MSTIDAVDPDIDGGHDLLARARDLVPLLSENAARTDRERRVPAGNLAALTHAGLFRMMTPRRWGGYETGIATKIRVVSEVARGCGSTGWIVDLLTGGAWLAGMMNEQVQRDVWANGPDAKVAVSVHPAGSAEIVESGYRISGRWARSSGAEHADWLMLGVPVPTAGGELSPRVMAVPRDQVGIEDTWQVTGMRGTETNAVVADGVTVPFHRTAAIEAIAAGQLETPFEREAPYHVPLSLGIVASLTGSQLGLARAALDLVIGNAAHRRVSASFDSRQAAAPTVQLAVARAASAIDTAHALVFTAAEELDRASRIPARPSDLDRARLHAQLTRAIVEAREAIRELMAVAGTSAFGETNPLQRIWRDSEMAASHATANPATSAESYGRLLLGVTDPVAPKQ